MSSSATTTNPQCTVILTLAHLLQQHSLSYDDEKNVLLESSVKCGMKLASSNNQGNTNNSANGDGNTNTNIAVAVAAAAVGEGELHMVLTGSPRPTFAETNAWLLEGEPNGAPTTPRRKSRGDSIGGGGARERSGSTNSTGTGGVTMPGSFRGSYSILDNAVSMTNTTTTNNNDCEDDDDDAMSLDETNDKEVLQEYISSLTEEEKKSETSSPDIDKVNLNKGPMVGHAVVNAVNQTQGVGLRSSRAKLLQGTIDRPLWDQRRWTDGECLFSELVDKCRLENGFYDLFERRNNTGRNANATAGGSVGGGADAAAGGGVGGGGGVQQPAPAEQSNMDLSAHLITVPAIIINPNTTTVADDDEVPGLEEDTVIEIARGILRCLKRKKSPPTSKVYLVLPPDPNVERDAVRKQAVHSKLAAAWEKLERYNDMIGAPRLMADAEFEFVDVSFY